MAKKKKKRIPKDLQSDKGGYYLAFPFPFLLLQTNIILNNCLMTSFSYTLKLTEV